MGVAFAGIDLIHPDPDGNIQAWLDDFLPISESRMILDWPTPQNNFSISPYYNGQDMPVPNWSKPPRPKINSWYRPTGASRWSFGFFLADYARMQTILSAIGTNNAPQILTLDMFPTPGHSRSWGGCYLLPPHPVSASATDVAGLWILPIVDERWYWQFATAFETPIDATSPTAKTWAQQFSEVAAGLGISLSVDTIPDQYLRPNLFFINGTNWQSTAAMADAMAFSVGQRIIPQYPAYGPNTAYAGGSYLSAGWGTSKGTQTTNLAATADVGVLQGGQLAAFPAGAAITPESVIVVFRTYKNGIVIGDWKNNRYQSEISAAGAGQTGGVTAGYSVTILSTALADISTGGDPLHPDNGGTLDAAALRVAIDYYAGLWIQDSAIPGISQWQESGYDDWVEFTPGRPDGGGAEPSTRIHSRPYNFTFERMIHYDPSTWEYGERISGTLDGSLSAHGTQTITLIKTDGATPAGGGHLTVTDILGGTADSGDKIEALRFGDVWAVVGAIGGGSGGGSYTGGGATISVGSCAAVVFAGGSGLFTLSVPAAIFPDPPLTVTASVNGGICLGSPDGSGNTINYLIGKLQDGTYAVLNPTRLFYGQFATMVDMVFGSHTIAGLSGTFTIFSGNPGAEASTGTSVTAFLRDGVGIPGRTYVCIVTPNNTYEKLDDGALIPGFASSESIMSAATVEGATLNTTYGPLNVEFREGIIFSGNTNLYLLGNTTPDLLTTYSRLRVLNPSLTFAGTIAATTVPGGGSPVSTGSNGVAAINETNNTIHSGATVVCIWEQKNKRWLIVACPNP